MSYLFNEIRINGLVLKNRFIMSAAIGLREAETFAALAKENVGLIISGGLETNEIAGFEKIIRTVHDNHGKIALQLVTSIGGRFGFDADPIAVSVLQKDNPFFNPLVSYCPHHEATEKEIETIINSYAESASIAKMIGADAVEIHSAHQSFLSQFLSPLTNTRTDRWGGSIENRTRIHREILSAIRAKVGDSFPLFIKVGVEDALPNGLKFIEGLEIASRLAAIGYDALEISLGLQDFQKLFATGDWSGTPMQSKKSSFYYRNWTKEIKRQVSVPVIMVGGIRSFKTLEEMLNNHEADLFGLCRPLIREPNLISRWEKNDLRPPKCLSCNQCLTEIYMKGNSLECFFETKLEPKS
jgi:2,4-dienoyl-CoA reductase-like NADH-dependent reductase (Old Yellow Enzyme family)